MARGRPPKLPGAAYVDIASTIHVPPGPARAARLRELAAKWGCHVETIRDAVNRVQKAAKA
jgi:hypothetical protein